eukprot:366481-Chlamydomonas_euryale.AAC.5
MDEWMDGQKANHGNQHRKQQQGRIGDEMRIELERGEGGGVAAAPPCLPGLRPRTHRYASATGSTRAAPPTSSGPYGSRSGRSPEMCDVRGVASRRYRSARPGSAASGAAPSDASASSISRAYGGKRRASGVAASSSATSGRRSSG